MRLSVLLLLLGTSFCVIAQQPQKKIALVIGVQNYTGIPKLRNSLNDAKAISSTLLGKGFQVRSLYDPKTRTEIKDGINWYFNQMHDQEGAVGLIFYAGHGMQYLGENYIIPVTATLRDPSDLEDYCVKMNAIVAILSAATSSLNILILDACRSLPSFSRGVEQGLTKMDAPQGSIIVFATQPGKVASDGFGTHGLFTSKFLAAINEPNLNISEVFQRVKREVYAESRKDQLPSIEDNAIGGDFFFTYANHIEDNSNKPATQSVVNTDPIFKDKEADKTTIGSEKGSPQGRLDPNALYGAPAATSPDYADGQAITVGSQSWLGKNLDVTNFANGDAIPETKTEVEWERAAANRQPAFCFYNNDAANGRTLGKLYNWYAVTDARGLAPKGWHIPSGKEWNSLITYLGGETTAGASLRGTLACHPGGWRGIKRRATSITYNAIGTIGYWWSSSAKSGSDTAQSIGLYEFGRVFMDSSPKLCGLSVRCIKD